MTLLELIQSCLPTKANKLEYLEHQREMRKLSTEKVEVTPEYQELYNQLVARFEREESLKTPRKKRWEYTWYNWCNSMLRRAQRNWPVE